MIGMNSKSSLHVLLDNIHLKWRINNKDSFNLTQYKMPKMVNFKISRKKNNF